MRNFCDVDVTSLSYDAIKYQIVSIYPNRWREHSNSQYLLCYTDLKLLSVVLNKYFYVAEEVKKNYFAFTDKIWKDSTLVETYQYS